MNRNFHFIKSGDEHQQQHQYKKEKNPLNMSQYIEKCQKNERKWKGEKKMCNGKEKSHF